MELKWTVLLLGLLLAVLAEEAASCKQGFQRVGKNCTDEDECALNVCVEHSVCHNTVGSYYCTCERGFQSTKSYNFTAENGECQDINECIINNTCPNNSRCINTIGSYRCDCLPGYKIFTPSATCTDVDECESEEHKCGKHGNCSNTPGSYNCTCNPGYSNYGNSRAKCTELKCNRSSLPSKQSGMDDLLNLFMSSCQSLSQPMKQHDSGEALLKNLLDVGGKVMSTGKMEDSSKFSTFLDAMEDTLRLIGPQLNSSRTTMNNNMSDACLEVKKDATRPNGSVMMSSDGVHLNISWKTAVGEDYLGFAYVALVSYKHLDYEKNSILEDQGDESSNVSYQLNSPVVTTLVSNPNTQHLPDPVTLTFAYKQEGAASKQLKYSCVYWDENQEGGVWSRKGCTKAEFNSTHAVCTWTHLSSFAVLMALYPVKNTFELVLITRIGLSVSLVCLAVCILTFWLCRSIKGTRTTIHLHLCVSLFFADFIFLFFITSTSNRVGCGVVAGLLHYLFLASFCWMLLEGVQLYRMVVLVFHTTLRPLYLFIGGYGAPLAIVIISAIANSKRYGTDTHCWLSLEDNFIWSFFAPVCIIIILNSFFFVITVWKLAGKFSSLNPDISKLKKLRGFVVTAVAQLCVLGGMWVFGVFMFQEEGTVVMLYLFTILNSLQGALIFIMHCLMSKTIREEYSKLCGGVCRAQKKRYSEFTSNQTSNSQKPLRSAPSTGESQI